VATDEPRDPLGVAVVVLAVLVTKPGFLGEREEEPPAEIDAT
jgi:hypothetical protein